MDIDQPEPGFFIEEYALDELQTRFSKSRSFSSNGKLKARHSGPRPSNTVLNTPNNSSSAQQIDTTETVGDIDTTLPCAIPSTSTSSEMDLSVEYVEETPNIAMQNWPGHMMDVKMPSNENDVYSPSREGYLIIEIISQLIFIWGLSSAPIHTLRNTLKDELPDSSNPCEDDDFSDLSLPSADQQKDKDVKMVTVNQISGNLETFIEEYDSKHEMNRKLIQSDTDHDDEEKAPKKTRTQIYYIQKALTMVDSLESQLTKLRFLIWEEYHRPVNANSPFLSHILMLVGPSLGMSKQGLCIVRSNRANGASNSNQSIPPKNRSDDTLIRSTLRNMLQHVSDMPSTRQQFSKMQAKIHFLVCFSTSSQNAESLCEPLSSDVDLSFSRLPTALLTKWNKKKPIKSIRICGPDQLLIPQLTDPEITLTAQLGDPLILM